LGLTAVASATQLIPALGTSAPSSHFFDEMQEMQLGAHYAEALVGFEDPTSAASDRTWDK
jgi:hypothetical protein